MFAQVGELASSKSAMKTFGAGVEGVDHHLAVGRAGDLDPAVLEVGGRGGDLPVGFAHVLRFRQEIGQLAGVDLRLTLLPAPEQFARRGSNAAQVGDKRQRLGA